MADLTVSGEFIVHKKIEARVYTFKVYENVIVMQPIRINIKATRIQCAGDIIGHVRRIDGVGIINVCVVGGVISMVQHALPGARDGDGFHAVRQEGSVCKIIYFVYGGIVAEFPIAAEIDKSRRASTYAFGGGVGILVRDKV